MEKYSSQKKEERVKDNIKLVHYVLNQLGINCLNKNYEDYYSEGLLGLVKAWKSYKDNNDTKFSSFACICIKNAILNKIRNEKKELLNYSVSLDTPINEYNDEKLTYIDTFADEEIDYSLKQTTKDIIKEIEKMNLRAKDIYIDYLKGIPQKEIAKRRYCSKQYINAIIIENNYRVRQKFKDYF